MHQFPESKELPFWMKPSGPRTFDLSFESPQNFPKKLNKAEKNTDTFEEIK